MPNIRTEIHRLAFGGMGVALANLACITPVSAQTPPSNPLRGAGGPQVQFAAAPARLGLCRANASPTVLAVNGRISDVTFAPGQAYTLTGCNLGTAGTARLSSYAPAYGGFTIPLIVDSWNPSTIIAHIDANFGGAPSVPSVNVQVTPAGGGEVGLGGAFPFKAVEVERMICLPTGKLAQYFTIGPRAQYKYSSEYCDRLFTTINGTFIGTTTAPNVNISTMISVCQKIKIEYADKLFDLYDLSPIWSRGFIYEGVWNDERGRDGSRVDTGGAGVSLGQNHELRVSLPFSESGSGCEWIYHLAVKVRGPRGVDPYPIAITNTN